MLFATDVISTFKIVQEIKDFRMGVTELSLVHIRILIYDSIKIDFFNEQCIGFSVFVQNKAEQRRTARRT